MDGRTAEALIAMSAAELQHLESMRGYVDAQIGRVGAEVDRNE